MTHVNQHELAFASSFLGDTDAFLHGECVLLRFPTTFTMEQPLLDIDTSADSPTLNGSSP